MRPHDRLAYSPITERPQLILPGGKRLAVWVIVNVEEWDIDQPMPRTVLTPPAGGSPSPDIPNWAWHEYGNRVGFWRMLEVFDQHAIPAVLAVNGSCLATYPQIAQAALARRRGITPQQIRRAMRRHHLRFIRDTKQRQCACGMRHGVPIRLTAHNDTDLRLHVLVRAGHLLPLPERIAGFAIEGIQVFSLDEIKTRRRHPR